MPVFKASSVPLSVVQADGDWQGYLKLEVCGPSKPQMQLLPSAHASSPLAHYQRDERLGKAPLLAPTLQNLAPTECVEGPRTKSRGPLPVAGSGQGQAGCTGGSPEEGEQILSLGGLRGMEGSLLGENQ